LPPIDEPVLATELQGQNSAIETIAISPDGALLAAAGAEGFIDLWRLPGYEPAGSLAGSAYAVHTLDFSPDGATLAAGGHDGILRLWDVSALKERQAFRPSLATIIYRLDFSPDGGTLAVGTQLCVVQIVGSDDGILRRTLPQRGCGASSLRWVQSWGIDHLPDGEAILTGDGRGCCGGSVQRWEQDRFEPPVVLAGYGLPVHDIAVHPDGELFAVAEVGGPTVWIRATDDGALVHEMRGHVFRVTAIAFSPDGSQLATVSRDGRLTLWGVETGEIQAQLAPGVGPLTDVAFTPDGARLAASTADGRVLVWDAAP
jgi:WD40 repeat protein